MKKLYYLLVEIAVIGISIFTLISIAVLGIGILGYFMIGTLIGYHGFSHWVFPVIARSFYTSLFFIMCLLAILTFIKKTDSCDNFIWIECKG